MARVEIRVSDLTHEPIQEEEQAARLIVEHPDYPEPIGLDVLPEEIQGLLTEDRTRFVVLSLEDPDNPNPQRYVAMLEEFENLFQEGDSQRALQEAFTSQQQEREAQAAQSRRRGRRAAASGRRQPHERRQRVDYSSPEHAGEPHPGRITEAEQEYVREHLTEVNARLRQQGKREIDPSDPMMAERYGLPPQSADASIEEIERAPEA